MLRFPGSSWASLAAVWLILALLIGSSNGYPRSISRHGRQKNPLRPAKAVSLCGPKWASCAANSTVQSKASTPKNRGKGKSSIKRTLTQPSDDDFRGDIESFMVSQYVKADWVPHARNGQSSAIFRELGNRKFDLAVGDLWGCTSVVVVSERGVWMSHFWEEPSFGRYGLSNEVLPSSHDVFRTNILDPLEYGNQHMPGLTRFTGNGGAFNGAYRPAAYIFHPTQTQDDDYNRVYTARIQVVHRMLQELIPLRWPPLIYEYNRQGGDITSAKGKVLFQYDPNEAIIPNENGPVQTAMHRIWLEDQPKYIHQRYWRAWPQQRSAGNANQRRDTSLIPTPGAPSSVPTSALPSTRLAIANLNDSWEALTTILHHTPIASPTVEV
ncbi:hypothetical protein BDV26DRAFT_282457 [Aspergillus bertholletiae]|uniref:Uncharacterized protein n=1 Tax=Aspergillus bertholletiae TaxID=1226010 RepID=A0A5N7B3Z7_9EURO|nr:hypothetical protein BDV26DRAFT_282457 [Aspergillus bertholletiae]